MKKFIIKILNNEQINLEELNVFIIDYCKLMDNKIPDTQELSGISQLISHGMFNLNYACKQAAMKLNMQVDTLTDKNGQVIKSFVY